MAVAVCVVDALIGTLGMRPEDSTPLAAGGRMRRSHIMAPEPTSIRGLRIHSRTRAAVGSTRQSRVCRAAGTLPARLSRRNIVGESEGGH